MTVSMNIAPLSPLRQRMQHDMMMRGLGPYTQKDYDGRLTRAGKPEPNGKGGRKSASVRCHPILEGSIDP